MTGGLVLVSRVATKGQDKVGVERWVKKYFISLSADGSNYTDYEEGGRRKVSY